MSIIRLVDTLFTLYYWILLARIILSWVHVSPYHPVVRWIYRLTEPVLAPVRRALPFVGPFDFSPIIVFFLLSMVRGLVIRTLYMLGLW